MFRKTCLACSEGFDVTEDDLAFYDRVSPVFSGKKESVPQPTLCPECRRRRRLSFYNERKLYSRSCDKCKADIISIHHEEKPYQVYCRECYFSPDRDGLQYGWDMDFSKSFSENFSELSRRTPRKWMIQKGYTENSIYCNNVGSIKNGYLTFMGGRNTEDVLYCTQIRESQHCTDYLFVRECQYCYECVDCIGGYNLRFCWNTENCRDSLFLKNCLGCSNCFGCVNLRHKKYHFFNEPLGKEAYEKKMAEILPLLFQHSVMQQLRKKAEDFWLTFPLPALNNLKCENCTGDGLENCHDLRMVFDSFGAESGAYSTSIGTSKDFRDWDNYGRESELILEAMGVGSTCYRMIANLQSFNDNSNLFYTQDCMSCKDCFGCIGLQNKQYCIFNKQYTREEYESLVPRIIAKMREDGEWGEFFHSSLSPFGYNETVAQEAFPLAKEEALKLGFNWSDYVAPPPQVEKVIKASQLPDTIYEIPDTILDWAVECEVSGKPFRIIKQELKFLRENGLPLPRRHPDVRHLDRMALRNPRKLFKRKCGKCMKDIQTTYAPEQPEKVYCEECYLGEVY